MIGHGTYIVFWLSLFSQTQAYAHEHTHTHTRKEVQNIQNEKVLSDNMTFELLSPSVQHRCSASAPKVQYFPDHTA